MLKRLHWTVLRALPVPFVAAFGTLMFLLLMQFLIRYLPELVGRGLPLIALIELIAYSLAYMVTLAVPMAWLIALIAAFGRLSESRAYLVVKSAGVSLAQLAWPTLLVGAGLALGLAYFNNVMLPEANFRMAGLWRDIRLSRPGFELEPGIFYTGLDGYAIRAESIPPDSASLLYGVTVFDGTEPGSRAILVADRARLATAYGGRRLEMTLEDGELHRRTEGRRNAEHYERLAFRRHRLAFDISDLTFERRDESDGFRSDRTMRTSEMIAQVDSMDQAAAARIAELRRALLTPRTPDTLSARKPGMRLLASSAEAASPAESTVADSVSPDSTQIGVHRTILDGLSAAEREAAYDEAAQRARSLQADANATANAVQWEQQRADRYRVEIYKKNSIALACLVFVLIGVPLGLAVARGGVGLIATLAVIVFLFYWVTLVQGEKLADRGLLPPWLGMWAANVIVGLLGAWLAVREARDPASRDPIRRLAGLVQKKR
jgi:lipopolysaccharide export system permease protein